MRRETLGKPVFSTGKRRIQAGKARELSTILRKNGVDAIGVFFYALDAQEQGTRAGNIKI